MNKTIVLLHGALGSKEQMHALKSILDQNFRVLGFNFNGHGGLPPDRPFSIDLFVQNTIDFMDREDLEQVHVFGYSMGGYVALKLAHDHPKRVDRLVTLGTKFHWSPEAAAKEMRMMNPDIIAQKIPAFADTLAGRHHPADWKEIMRRTGEMMLQMGEGDHMTQRHFNAIPHPALICIGTNDHMVSIEESKRTADQLPHGHLQTINGFKHPLEAVDQNVLADICHAYFSS